MATRRDVFVSQAEEKLSLAAVGVDPGIAKMGAAIVGMCAEIDTMWPRVRLLSQISLRGAKETSNDVTNAQCVARLCYVAELTSCCGIKPMTPVHWRFETQQTRLNCGSLGQDMQHVLGGMIATQCDDADDIRCVPAACKLSRGTLAFCGLDPDDPENAVPKGTKNRIPRKRLGVRASRSFLQLSNQPAALAALDAMSPESDKWDVSDALLTALGHFAPIVPKKKRGRPAKAAADGAAMAEKKQGPAKKLKI